jgi:hypothetical protein
MRIGTWGSSRPAGKSSWKPRSEARSRKRLKMSLPVQVRSTSGQIERNDIGEVLNFHSEGLYFTTPMLHYAPGMRVIVTFPYGEHAPVRKTFQATVIRVEHCWLGSRGVAVSLATPSDAGAPAS